MKSISKRIEVGALGGALLPPASDTEWVERARAGDREAFGALVRRHRARARRLAHQLTADPHLAEDVVQDALLKAFEHIGTLVDADRFMPWLQRIVRNQALGKLRRGGPNRGELPITLLGPQSEVDSQDLDSILAHFAQREARAGRDDPEAHVLKGEFFGMLQRLVGVLSPRERAIFEAHFFDQLSPQEIACLLQTSAGNVYTSLHRAKAKVQRERLRIYIDAEIQRRKRCNAMSKRDGSSTPGRPRRFPFPQGGEPNEPETSQWATTALERAREAEVRGVESLDELLGALTAERRAV